MRKKIIGICIVIFLAVIMFLPVMSTTSVLNKKSIIIHSNLQESIELWNKTFGRDKNDLLYFIEETNEGGFIALGWTEENNGAYSSWMLKLNADGDEEWSLRELSNYDFIQASDLQQTSEGGYIACGYLSSNNWYGYNGFLWKVDESGSTEWTKTYKQRLWNVLEVDDGYICAGWTPIDDNNYDFALCKFDSSGVIQWEKSYDYANQIDYSHSLCKTNDDGYLIGGWATSYNQIDLWMVKTDSSGNKEWDRTHGGPDDDYSVSRNCFQTSEVDYVMIGITKSFGAGKNDIFLVKTDQHGEMKWNKTFGESTEERCYSMDTTHDNGYIICGTKNYDGFAGSRGDMWLIKTDDEGILERSQTFGGRKEDRGYYVSKTSDGGYILAGKTKSFSDNSYNDAWIIRLSSFSNNKPNNPLTSYDKTNDELIVSAIDPDGDKVKYGVSWENNNTLDYWTDLVDSGTELKIDCEDKQGTVGVIVEDEYGARSDWISVKSKNKIYINTLLLRFLYNHPILYQLLKKV